MTDDDPLFKGIVAIAHIRAHIKCVVCSKPRLVYSRRAPKDLQKKLLAALLVERSATYICGQNLVADLDDLHHLGYTKVGVGGAAHWEVEEVSNYVMTTVKLGCASVVQSGYFTSTCRSC